MSTKDKRKILTENNIEIITAGEKQMKAIAKMLHGVRIKFKHPHK